MKTQIKFGTTMLHSSRNGAKMRMDERHRIYLTYAEATKRGLDIANAARRRILTAHTPNRRADANQPRARVHNHYEFGFDALDVEMAGIVTTMRADPKWELATEREMYEWARVELYGTEAEQSAQAKRLQRYDPKP